MLLDRTPTWFPMLRTTMLLGGLGVALVVAISPSLRGRVGVVLAIAAVTLGLAAPAAYTLSTIAHPNAGALPTAGPAGAAGGPGGIGPRLGGNRGFTGARGAPPGGFGGTNPGGFNPGFGAPGFGGGGRGGAGGLLNGSDPSAQITALFEKSTGFRWTAAAVGANNAAGYQLASGQAIMAVGGFNGTDPTPTLAQFEKYVRAGEIHYFIAGGGGPGGGGPGGGGPGGGGAGASTSSAITQWVEQNFTAQTVGGTTIYDLSSATSG